MGAGEMRGGGHSVDGISFALYTCGHGLHNLWRSHFGVEHPFATYVDVHQYSVFTHSHV